MSKNTKNQLIDWDLFQEFVDEFKSESDRAAVILGAAKIDQILYIIIKYTLVPSSSSQDELLDGDSPLGTFSAKIKMMFRLGLIDASFVRALHIIRRIRNEFAHEVSGSSLSSGSHKDRVKELTKLFYSYDFFEHFKETFYMNKDDISTNFRAVLSIIIVQLEALSNSLKPLETKAWPLVTQKMKNYKKPSKLNK